MLTRLCAKAKLARWRDPGLKHAGAGWEWPWLFCIKMHKSLNYVFELLRSKIGSPISYQSIAEDVAISPYYFHEKYHLSAVQMVKYLRQERMAGQISIVSAKDYLQELFM